MRADPYLLPDKLVVRRTCHVRKIIRRKWRNCNRKPQDVDESGLIDTAKNSMIWNVIESYLFAQYT